MSIEELVEIRQKRRQKKGKQGRKQKLEKYKYEIIELYNGKKSVVEINKIIDPKINYMTFWKFIKDLKRKGEII